MLIQYPSSLLRNKTWYIILASKNPHYFAKKTFFKSQNNNENTTQTKYTWTNLDFYFRLSVAGPAFLFRTLAGLKPGAAGLVFGLGSENPPFFGRVLGVFSFILKKSESSLLSFREIPRPVSSSSFL